MLDAKIGTNTTSSGPSPSDLVGDVEIAAARVLRGRDVHRRSAYAQRWAARRAPSARRLRGMSTEPPQEPPTEVAPPRDQAPPGYQQPAGAPAPERHGSVGPWILAAAIVLVLGALAAVLVHNADTSDTQTVITRSPTVNTTSVERSGPNVTQATTTVTPPERTTTTVTVQPKTDTSPQTGGTTGP